MERRISELERKLNNLVQVCRVDQQNEDGTVSVELTGGQVSGPLPVLHARTRETRDWNIPAVGELVLCVFLPVGMEQGFVLGSMYSESDKVPGAAKGERVIAGDPVLLGDETAGDYVALAEAVYNNFSLLKTAIAEAVPVPNDGGTIFQAEIIGNLNRYGYPLQVAAKKTKAK